jgi:hypothetical protein
MNKKIKERFQEETSKNPSHTSIYCFNCAIEGQRFSIKDVKEAFRKLVDKEDTQGCREEVLANSLSLLWQKGAKQQI